MQITRCPRCGAAFRVASDQLRVRNGLVRCGDCHTVFDGYAGLVSPGSSSAPSSAPWPASSPAPASVPAAAPAWTAPVSPEPPAPVIDHAPKVIRSRADMASPHADDSMSTPLPGDDAEQEVRVLGESRTRLIDALDSGRSPPPFMDDAAQTGGRATRTAWMVAAVAALLLLLAQATLVYRTQLALAFPALRPALSLLCQPLECRVGYARRIERISIMSSSLQRPPSGTAPEGALVLHVVMRNRYDLPQEWPALMLTLTDMSDTVVARRALRPQDYLPAPDQDPGPFGAGQEVTLAVPIDPGALAVNGYRIDKFFP